RSRATACGGDAGQEVQHPDHVAALVQPVRKDDGRLRYAAVLRLDPLDRRPTGPGAAARRQGGGRLRGARAAGTAGDRRGRRRRDPDRLDDDAPGGRAPADGTGRTGDQPGAARDQDGRALRPARPVPLEGRLHVAGDDPGREASRAHAGVTSLAGASAPETTSPAWITASTMPGSAMARMRSSGFSPRTIRSARMPGSTVPASSKPITRFASRVAVSSASCGVMP